EAQLSKPWDSHSERREGSPPPGRATVGETSYSFTDVPAPTVATPNKSLCLDRRRVHLAAAFTLFFSLRHWILEPRSTAGKTNTNFIPAVDSFCGNGQPPPFNLRSSGTGGGGGRPMVFPCTHRQTSFLLLFLCFQTIGTAKAIQTSRERAEPTTNMVREFEIHLLAAGAVFRPRPGGARGNFKPQLKNIKTSSFPLSFLDGDFWMDGWDGWMDDMGGSAKKELDREWDSRKKGRQPERQLKKRSSLSKVNNQLVGGRIERKAVDIHIELLPEQGQHQNRWREDQVVAHKQKKVPFGDNELAGVGNLRDQKALSHHEREDELTTNQQVSSSIIHSLDSSLRGQFSLLAGGPVSSGSPRPRPNMFMSGRINQATKKTW
ncbi:hypothetical protein L249_0246, partial [Ophiocordyceps polyrhachis-furcata BCC 54312]